MSLTSRTHAEDGRRVARLSFRNLTGDPLRLFLPPEPFRAGISDFWTWAGDGEWTYESTPHPHGYAINEGDFPLLDRGAVVVLSQRITLASVVPGRRAPGSRPELRRRPGLSSGCEARVRWTYANRGTRWPGGSPTLDGLTLPLFGGGDIPLLWTGSLTVEGVWTIPPDPPLEASPPSGARQH